MENFTHMENDQMEDIRTRHIPSDHSSITNDTSVSRRADQNLIVGGKNANLMKYIQVGDGKKKVSMRYRKLNRLSGIISLNI